MCGVDGFGYGARKRQQNHRVYANEARRGRGHRVVRKRVSTEVLHGDIAQAQRERTLQRFRQDKFSVLVATDVAARGLDVDNVDLVVHYELPNETESFVHRCGRTGRAGKKGTAIALPRTESFTDCVT